MKTEKDKVDAIKNGEKHFCIIFQLTAFYLAIMNIS